MSSYIDFLFNPDGSAKPKVQPVLYYMKKTDSFKIAYSVPGYHSPRQYFSFSVIPDVFPNHYLSELFYIYSINESILYRHPSKLVLKPKRSVIKKYFGLPTPVKSYSQDEIDAAKHNLNLAIKLGSQYHSMFFFDDFLNAYKILHPEVPRYSKSKVSELYSYFNKLIS